MIREWKWIALKLDDFVKLTKQANFHRAKPSRANLLYSQTNKVNKFIIICHLPTKNPRKGHLTNLPQIANFSPKWCLTMGGKFRWPSVQANAQSLYFQWKSLAEQLTVYSIHCILQEKYQTTKVDALCWATKKKVGENFQLWCDF